jgi:Mn-dependent DtxR family transcriptional regulator
VDIGKKAKIFEQQIKSEIQKSGAIETGDLAKKLSTNRQRLLPYLKRLESQGFLEKVRRGKRTLLLKK